MRSTYRKLGPYIREVVKLNRNLQVELLLGVSVSKKFIPSIANTIGTDMSRYKIVRQRQFAYGPVTSRNSDKVSIALLSQPECIISTSYIVFDVIDKEQLLPEYLMMWFRRPEFDRYARFKSHGSVRELFDWDEMCDIELPIPSIEKQREMVNEYQTVVDRTLLNERLIEMLEEATQAIYMQWFVEFEFPISAVYAESIGAPELVGQPYKSSGGEMEYNEVLEKEIPKGWNVKAIGELVQSSLGGDWGKDTAMGSYSEEVKCIRGTDIPACKNGKVYSLPCRFILKKNLNNKLLKAGDIVIEISGGSPVQATGRATLITERLLSHTEVPIICSNFCRRIVVADKRFIHFIFSHLQALYLGGVMFAYENSTTGVKNLDLDGFFREEFIPIPDVSTLAQYQKIFEVLLGIISIYGREHELIDRSRLDLVSTFIFWDRDKLAS